MNENTKEDTLIEKMFKEKMLQYKIEGEKLDDEIIENMGKVVEEALESDNAKSSPEDVKNMLDGYAEMLYSLACCYYVGEKVRKNPEKTVWLLKKAIKLGHSGAQNNLGDCYENGFGVDKDLEKAKYWYTQSANQGYSLAKEGLDNIKKLEKENNNKI